MFSGRVNKAMKILFCHGRTSVPGGRKLTYLADHGHEILNPALPDDDFEEAVRIAQAEYDQHHPDVIVGSSRGGAVAMNVESGDTPLVLLCPAWKKWGSAKTVKKNATVLHSRADDVVPFEDSEELVANSGLLASALIEIGTDHRLADPEPLAKMLEECERLQRSCSFRASLISILSRIRRSAAQRGRKTELPTAEFSDAIRAVGEHFVDSLLHEERRGRWWLGDDGRFYDCAVRRLGSRVPRNFARGTTADWSWFPEKATRLADPMTGPDHIVSVNVPSLKFSGRVCLEQKLRFNSPQDVFAGASTYLKHLDLPSPNNSDTPFDEYFTAAVEDVKSVLGNTGKNGSLTYSGSVPQVCFACIALAPHTIAVVDKSGKTTIECDHVGFLAPTINWSSFAMDSHAVRLVRRAKVKLWIGLDSLLKACTDEEVEEAWSAVLQKLTEDIRNPNWR